MAYELPALTPQYLLALTALALLVIDTLAPESRNNLLLAGTAVVGAALSMLTSGWFLLAGTGQDAPIVLFGDAVVVDGLGLFFAFVFASVTALVVLASHDYVADQRHLGEFYSLVLLAATGMSLMAVANSLASAFVALELASLPSYALVAYLKHNRGSVEAGLKYFLVGAVSSAIFLYGISLVYVAGGSLVFGDVAGAVAGTEFAGILGLGVVLVIGGFAFKTASVPFHFWAPEAYEGAPAPVSAFLSSASKAAGFALAFRVFATAFPLGPLADAGVDWAFAFAILAVVTMTLGNLAAATQDKVKRMLAYSSIGHAGYVLIALAALGGGNDDFVLGAGMMHLLVYGFMNTGAFLFIALTEYWEVGRTFEDFNGLAEHAPVACLAMTVFLFNLAGLPVGAGILSKYVLFAGAVGAGFWWLAAIAAANSALSLYYYSRVVKAMWFEEPSGRFEIDSVPVGIYAAILLAAVVTVVLLPGFDPVARLAIDAAAALFG